MYGYHAANDLPISPVLPLVDKRVLSVRTLRHDDRLGRQIRSWSKSL